MTPDERRIFLRTTFQVLVGVSLGEFTGNWFAAILAGLAAVIFLLYFEELLSTPEETEEEDEPLTCPNCNSDCLGRC